MWSFGLSSSRRGKLLTLSLWFWWCKHKCNNCLSVLTEQVQMYWLKCMYMLGNIVSRTGSEVFKTELSTSWRSRCLKFLTGILCLDCFMFPRFLLICHMRLTQSNKRFAWFLGFQNRSRNRVLRVFLNWNSEKPLIFSLLIWTDLLGIFQRKSLLVGSPN